MTPAPERLVIFDVDGTLVDSQHLIFAAMTHAFDALGETLPPRAEVLGIVGLSLAEAMGRLAPHLPASGAERLAEEYRQYFTAQRVAGGEEAMAPLYPGARDALARIAARAALLGVATGKARRGLDHVLDGHGLGHLFSTVQTADGHPSKPHPSMVLTALAETGLAPGQAVMIGDTEFDIEMGRAAGVATIGVAWGYHTTDRLAAAGADRVIAEFAALDDALADLPGWSA